MSSPPFRSPLPRSPDSATAAPAPKVCRSCGSSVVGKKRFKDARGYLCADCEKLDRVVRHPCAACGKPTLPENLRPWGTETICPACFAEREADPSARRLKKISARKHEAAYRQSTIVVAVVLIALLLLAALARLGCA